MREGGEREREREKSWRKPNVRGEWWVERDLGTWTHTEETDRQTDRGRDTHRDRDREKERQTDRD